MIACCYCGVQSAFVPDAVVHALVCSTCGAPLSAQKQRPLADHKGAKLPSKSEPAKVKKAYAGDWKSQAAHLAADKLRKKKKKKSKKSPWKSVFGEVFDVIEDIFD